MNNLWQDLRYAGRVLFKNPAFSVIAVVALGLGIGASTAIYSVVDALLLRPIAFKDSDRLVLLWNHYPGLNIAQEWLSPGEYLDIKTQAESFEEIAICVGRSFNLTGGDAPERIEGARVSSSLFSLLQVTTAKGRIFFPEDDHLIGAVTSEVKATDPDLPVYAVAAMKERLADSLTRRRFSMLLLGLFAALALILGVVGIYGVMAYVVGQRTHEIGIRMALGAERRDVLKLIVGQGMSLALAGVMIGVAAAFCLTRLMAGLRYGVSATDGLTFLVIAFLLTCCSLFACWIPARRATRVDPMVALRYE